jgi:hypothetical protein
VACPFFMPEQRFDSDWPFPQRLPLGAGWTGMCTAPGHEGVHPSDEEMKSGCNIGYAKTCMRLPPERHADAVHFALCEERDGILHMLFVCERDYLPVDYGELLYETANTSWLHSHPDPRVQRMAECYLQAQRTRRPNLRRAGEKQQPHQQRKARRQGSKSVLYKEHHGTKRRKLATETGERLEIRDD